MTEPLGIYGLEPTPTRFRNAWLRPRAPLSGLFFAGSEVATVGVIGLLIVTSVLGLVQLRGAVVLHEGSTIVVVLNALRLLRFRV